MYGVERIEILDTRVRGRINEGKVVESTRACDGEHVIVAHGCLRQPYPKDCPGRRSHQPCREISERTAALLDGQGDDLLRVTL